MHIFFSKKKNGYYYSLFVHGDHGHMSNLCCKCSRRDCNFLFTYLC